MFRKINDLIYSAKIDDDLLNAMERSLAELLDDALGNGKIEARLQIHQMLYVINLAHISCSWDANPKNIFHPLIVSIKHKIESQLENQFVSEHFKIIADLNVKGLSIDSLVRYIQEHPASKLNELDAFLKDEASLDQLKEFLLQETPLEMLFGDIIGFLLPGTYGSIKMEILKNYWDELGAGKIKKIHRNLRARLMKKMNISKHSYISNVEMFILEELELINLYMSYATNRSKHTELTGVLLATELSVVNHFEYQIAGWRRLGFDEHDLAYFNMHISIDGTHSEDWVNKVIKPIIDKNHENLYPITLGVLRRLTIRNSLVQKLYDRLRYLSFPL